MRPSTLAEAIERIRAGEPQDNALAEFVDSFLSRAGRRAEVCEHRRGAGAHGRCAAECARGRHGGISGQAVSAQSCAASGFPTPWRRLDEPWFTTSSTEPAMQEYLAFASPAEFRSRNIFTEERPLRRARAKVA